MFLGMIRGIFGTKNSGFNQTRDQGMIAGQQLKFSAPEQIQMTVANVRVIKSGIDQSKCGAGSAHADQVRTLSRLLLNSIVGLAEGLEQMLLGACIRRIRITLLHGIDRNAAGNLSAFVATHAVGYNRKTPQA